MKRYTISYKDKAEWLSIRERFVTGTEIPVIMGLSKFETPKELFERKINKIPKLQTEAMGWGLKLEPLIAKTYAEEKGIKLRKANKIFVCEPIAVSLDYICNKEIYEIKSSSFWKNEINGIPEYIYSQVQAQLFATGFNKAYVIALIGGNKLSEFEILPNDDFINEMLNYAKAFREALDKNDYNLFEEFLQKKIQVANEFVTNYAVEITQDLINEYIEINELIKQLEEQKDTIASKIKDYVTANNIDDTIFYDKIRVTKIERESVDYKALVNKYIPDKVLEAIKKTSYITIKLLSQNNGK
jgi:putative phage-type endonuclease